MTKAGPREPNTTHPRSIQNRGSKHNRSLRSDLYRDRILYLFLIPVFGYYILFHYLPLYGLSIAFKDYNMFRGIRGSEWIGLEVFKEVVEARHFWLAFRNTLMLNGLNLVFGFPMPIILAIMLNEVTRPLLKRVLQATVYLPHFISWVVAAGMFMMVLSVDGVVNRFMGVFGIEKITFFLIKPWWVAIFVSSSIWKEIGWGSIIYMAAITAINPEIYEAAIIDGTKKIQRIWHVTLPGIRATIAVLLILRIGRALNIGFEQAFMLGNSLVSEVSDVLSVHTYYHGLVNGRFSYATAVGLFRAVVNFTLLITVNQISLKISDEGLF